jgi:hypothetical protein
MAVHVPDEPGRLQFSQVPEQPLLQQTPSTQFPFAHSEPAEQASPLFFLHVFPMHV